MEREALKAIGPSLAAEETVIERFKREILLSRKVTHPGVCRSFELGHHRLAACSVVQHTKHRTGSCRSSSTSR